MKQEVQGSVEDTDNLQVQDPQSQHVNDTQFYGHLAAGADEFTQNDQMIIDENRAGDSQRKPLHQMTVQERQAHVHSVGLPGVNSYRSESPASTGSQESESQLAVTSLPTTIIVDRRRQNKGHQQKNKRGPYMCVLCGVHCKLAPPTGFENAAQVKEDIHRHLLLFQCNTCFKRFPKRHNLMRHSGQCKGGPPCQGDRKPLSVAQQEIFLRLRMAKGIDEIQRAVKGWKVVFAGDEYLMKITTRKQILRESPMSFNSDSRGDRQHSRKLHSGCRKRPNSDTMFNKAPLNIHTYRPINRDGKDFTQGRQKA
ncbi:hypothetical protein BDZ91DRAFT_783412 [Kalaharituber pfeilii]|nr:hypothetical protein BDZ91DRAFT_783412 [Kalaharituber pfeilii]